MGLQDKINTLTDQLTREHAELASALGRLSDAFDTFRTSQDVMTAEVAALKAQLAELSPPVDTTALETAVANVTASADAIEALIPEP